MAVVYQHIRCDTKEIFYIGIGKTKKRAYSKNGRNLYWKRVVSKVSYEVEILFEDLSWEEACNKEKELILKYGRKNLEKGTLVNMTNGGEGQLGVVPWMKGRTHTEEAKQKNREAHLGKSLSEEHKKNIGLAMVGKPQSEEKRKKLRVARANQVFTEERNTKISKSITELWKDPVYRRKVKRTTGMKRVHKDRLEKLVALDLLFDYLRDGWILGRSKEVVKKITSAKTK
jgi:hypothetical protein